MNRFIILAMLATILACTNKNSSENTGPQDSDLEAMRNKEAREDSTKLAEALALRDQVIWAVQPQVETKPVGAATDEDAADDPAFWLHPTEENQSILFGTNKKGGIYAYNLLGEELAYYEVGAINNIGIRQGVVLGSDTLDVLGGSNRTDNSIVLYQIEKNGQLKPLLQENFVIDTTTVDEVYGFCMYKDPNGRAQAIVNGKNGRINAYSISKTNAGVVLEKEMTWKLDSQPEGMVADDLNQVLYIGEEEKGIWKTSLAGSSSLSLIETSTKEVNSSIAYDIEGLSLYVPADTLQKGFLIASIQGSFSYALFERNEDNQYIGSFKITDAPNIDGVEETDGLEIVSVPVGTAFPNGLLIVQDGFNYKLDSIESQNFKVVDLREILNLLEK